MGNSFIGLQSCLGFGSRAQRWTGYTLLIAGSVETVQAVLYPERSATFVDVVSNTLGGLLGAALVALVRWRAARRSETSR